MYRIICVLCIMLLLALSAAPLAVSAVSYAAADVQTSDGALISAAPTQADGEVAEDGINTNVVTAWIVAVSAVVCAALAVMTVVLARKNRNAK